MTSQVRLPGPPRRGGRPRASQPGRQCLGVRPGPKLIVSTGFQCAPRSGLSPWDDAGGPVVV